MRVAPVRFRSVTVWGGTVRANLVFGSGGSCGERGLFCVSVQFEQQSLQRTVPVSVPGKTAPAVPLPVFRKTMVASFPVSVRFLSHPAVCRNRVLKRLYDG